MNTTTIKKCKQIMIYKNKNMQNNREKYARDKQSIEG